MPKEREEVTREAIAWIIRLQGGDTTTWRRFTAWLEADPAHSAAYNKVAALDAVLDYVPVAAPRPLLSEASAAVGPRRRTVLGWATAAAIAGIIAYSAFERPHGSMIVETAPGERRTVSLKDGSRIDLNGGTHIEVASGTGRRAKLERGEALFHVVHDPDRPFRVEIGQDLVEDTGTTFNILQDGERLSVEVSEGSVIFNPEREKVELAAGMTLVRERDMLTRGRRDISAIGSWQAGELVYEDAPLSRVASDLSRQTGLVVRAAPNLADRRFSGVIILAGDKAGLLQSVSDLLGVGLRRQEDAWVFVPTAQ